MKNKKNHDIIEKHIFETRTAYENGTIDNLRKLNSDKYNIVELEFPFGKRTCLEKKKQEDYLLIQKSRGGSVNLCEDQSYTTEENLAAAKNNIEKFNEIDMIRIKEIDFLIDQKVVDLPSDCIFSELGFRCAKLINFYQKNHGMKCYGYDVIDSNVAVANCLGYETFIYDFNDCEKELNLRNSNLVVSYHMLEHVTNPLKAVKKIYNNMTQGSYFHVEIPIEPFGPNIRYCHMYPFHKNDMHEMLRISGFKILTVSDAVQPGGPVVERYMCVKA